MIQKIKLSIIGMLFIILYLFNNTYALTTFKECDKNNGGYPSRVLCDNNYYLYYNLQSLHDTLIEIIQKYPTKIDEVKSSLIKILTNLKDVKAGNNKELINEKKICNYFFKENRCKNGYYNNLKDLNNEQFIESLNQKGIVSKELIYKNIFKDIKTNDNTKVEIYERIQQSLQKFKNSLSEFTTTLGVILSKKGEFTFSNVIGGTPNINLRLEALTNPDNLTKSNSKVKHYKIGLINIFEPFLSLSYDYFWALPLAGRYIANPYIIFGIIWYYIAYISIILLTIFIILSAFLFPLIEKKEENTNILKRRNIWLLMMNSTEFNFIRYIYKIFLTNESYTFKNDESKTEITIKNEYRVPFIARLIIKNEHVGLGYIIIIWLIMFMLLQGLSGYLV